MPAIKIATIVGARPQFIKAAAISRAIKTEFPGQIDEFLIHSGQHYDENMSKVFFEEMEIPEPRYHLEVGSGSHGYMTAEIIRKTEQVLVREKPDLVIVYGDTNTTLAGAIAASKLHIPVAHVEAGLRSFNKSMPEEINRVLCDHVSTLLFTPTLNGVRNLAREGFNPDATAPYSADNPKVFHCGDVMYDNALYFAGKAQKVSPVLKNLGLEGKEFVLCTIHRDSNTDIPARLTSILEALDSITAEFNIPVVLPLHPRTLKMLGSHPERALMERLANNKLFLRIPPAGYFDMLLLEKQARMIITDSGGVQKESYFFRKPCLVLRAETEWTELLEQKTALLVDADKTGILASFRQFYQDPPVEFPPLYGDGAAASFICRQIITLFG